MSIAVDLRSLLGGKISGVENYARYGINSLALKGVSLKGILNSYREPELPPLDPSVPIIRSKIPNKFFNRSLTFFGYPKFEQLYGSFDCLWMPDLRPFSIQKKTKLALNVHDLSPVIHPEFYSLKRRIWHWEINYRKSYERADLIFALSEYTKYDLIKIFNIPEKKIQVVYPGIDHQLFHTNLDQGLIRAVKSKYRLPEKYILSISTIEPRKNLKALVEAFESISDQDVHLVLAGKLGWLYSDFLKRVDCSKKRDKIHILGYIDEEDKPYLIAQAQLICYPSFYEGFGFVPLEAMACGVPTITSARTAMPEACGNASLLVEPYLLNDLIEGINQLLSDSALRQYYINKGLERVKLFSWDKYAEEVSNSLTSLA